MVKIEFYVVSTRCFLPDQNILFLNIALKILDFRYDWCEKSDFPILNFGFYLKGHKKIKGHISKFQSEQKFIVNPKTN